MVFKIHGPPDAPRIQRSTICCEYADIGYEVVPHKLPITDEGFLRANPLGRMPTLEMESGDGLGESNAILTYIAGIRADLGLTGDTLFEKAKVSQWLQMTEADVVVYHRYLLYWKLFPENGYKYNATEHRTAVAAVVRILKFANEHLRSNTYLVSEKITCADMAFVTGVLPVLQHVLTEAERKEYPFLMRYMNTCVAKTHFAKILGEVVYPGQTYVQEMEEENKKKKEAAMKAKQPAVTPAAEESPMLEKKEKHPLESLPPSSMVFDEWKRQYSNNDTRSVALPWLWENLDKEGYTFWLCKYKYNDELTKTFMAANLITGWFQRIEHIRKYLFGNVIVFGKSGDKIEISGAWIVRGDIPPIDPVMMGELDAECYEWRKMDINDPAEKKLFEDYCSWDGDFKGGSELEVNQGKTFK